MTVKELIAKLQEMPQDKIVIMWGDADDEYGEVKAVIDEEDCVGLYWVTIPI